MDDQQKQTITNILKLCKNIDFDNKFENNFYNVLTEHIFKTEITKYVSIDCSKYITKDKCQENKLTTLRTNLNKVIISNEVNNLLSDLLNFDKLTELNSNYYIGLIQILYMFDIIRNERNTEIKQSIINMIQLEIFNNLPKDATVNNLKNIFYDIDVFNDKILDELYFIFTNKQNNIENLYNFISNIMYDYKFARFMLMIYDKAKLCKGTPFVPEYNAFKNYYNNVIKYNYNIYANNYMNDINLCISLNSMINDLNSIKKHNEAYIALKLFIDSYYNNISVEQIMDNEKIYGNHYKQIYNAYLYGLIYRYYLNIDNNIFKDFCMKFYDFMKSYWPNINGNHGSGIYFKFEENKLESDDLFNTFYYPLFDFMNFGMSKEDYIHIIENINNIIDEVNTNIIKQKKSKQKMNTKKATIPKTIKQDCWKQYFGTSGEEKCLCCNNKIITPFDFHAGHIISEFNGGNVTLDNLKPICGKCNRSMGKMNMDEFMSKYYPVTASNNI